MKLQHFYSDWNGLRSKKAYNRNLVNAVLQEAIDNGGKYVNGDTVVIVNLEKKIVEARVRIDNAYSSNLYRDMYRIL